MTGPKLLFVLPLLLGASMLAEDYKGPRPPKSDVPYLLHASDLVATEVTAASQESQKKSATYTIPGASSPVRTPLAEPIFILDSRQLDPASLELWRLEVRNGQRSVSITAGMHRKGSSGPFHLAVTKIGDHLYRIEVQDMLENGEYSLSPAGSNSAFCFQIY
ncbi:MAG: hypothetical protein ABSF98_21020 [Bryobacteraceae bacterium]|jgi:hypothetical protein